MGCQQSVAVDSHSEEITPHERDSAATGTRSVVTPKGGRHRLRRLLTKRAGAQDFELQVEKQPDDKLGVGLGNTSKGAVIFGVKSFGLLAQYNEDASEERKLRPGYIIVAVNGRTGYWDMFEELRKTGHMKMVISPTPPSGASATWFEDIENMGKDLDLESQGNNFVMRVKRHDGNDNKSTFSSLPMVKAGDIGVDQCAICLGDVDPNESLLRLPCNHAFHVTCAGRWLTEKGEHTRGKQQCCPLCCSRVVGESNEGEN